MRRVGLFVEDFAHEAFLDALVERLGADLGIEVATKSYSVRGGHGRMLHELRLYLRDVRQGREDAPDLLVIVRDANCEGFHACRREVATNLTGFPGLAAVIAIPDPHVERWLLLDSAAFKEALGHGCNAPDYKCERRRYKQLLIAAVRAAHIVPLLGGIEHTQSIVRAMDLNRMEKTDESLGALIRELRQVFTQWRAS